MKLFILEVAWSIRWIPVGFFPGDYRSIINELGDDYDEHLSRVRRVRSLEECLELEGRMALEKVPADRALSRVQMLSLSSATKKDIKWME